MQVAVRNVYSPCSDVLCRNLCFSWYFRISSLSFAPVQRYCSWFSGLCPASGLSELLFSSSKFCWFLVFYSGTNFGIVPQRLTSCPSSKSTAYSVGLFLEQLSFLLWYVPEHYIAFCTVCSVPYGLELWLWGSWALYSDSENAGPTPVLGSLHELNKSNEWINFKDWRFTCQISLNCFLFISLVCSFCGNEFSSSSKLGYVFRINICFYGLFFIFNSSTHLKFIVEFK